MLHVNFIQYRKLDFEEFCVAAIWVHQLEGMESSEQHQGLPMSCLRRLETNWLCLKELPFFFSSSVSNGKFWFNCLGTHPLLTKWFYDYVFLSALFWSLQALLTTQLLSHIWKEQKDFRTKILNPWPLDSFAIGGTWFNYKENFAVTFDYLETDTIFISWDRICHLE